LIPGGIYFTLALAIYEKEEGMDVIEAIKTRLSIRGYLPVPVDRKILEEILQVATRAPSADNSQPWEITVVTGKVLDDIRQANVAALRSGRPPDPDVPRKPYEGVFRKRQVELGIELYQLLGIARDDREKRIAWMERGFRYFDAPAAFILAADRSLEMTRSTSDIGGLAQTICLAALAHGLGSCITSQGVLYPEVVRQYAGIPETKRLFWSICIGYPDWEHPVNKLRSTREPLENNTTWLGFD
jgi:nitroreductase